MKKKHGGNFVDGELNGVFFGISDELAFFPTRL